VVAAAGIMIMEDAIDYSMEKLQQILSVNVSGCLLTAQAAARSFIKNKIDGSIVLVASMSGSVANRVRFVSNGTFSVFADINSRGFTHLGTTYPSPQYCRWPVPLQLSGVPENMAALSA
jgi:NAD(P)-dependent dehydrogenase (short-subunit alcohol dehydrogenase family)